eukprot:TRINITY_DN1669_c5_g1_i1.p1 TRINITY_DN1669_c5_g1~~TRINITY_DN1669_c5_g1_i1.p1  ORF type:complete len:283 (+),score=77.69 TRINITY_DN1669_c5_g1_i1:193-1041(+)
MILPCLQHVVVSMILFANLGMAVEMYRSVPKEASASPESAEKPPQPPQPALSSMREQQVLPSGSEQHQNVQIAMAISADASVKPSPVPEQPAATMRREPQVPASEDASLSATKQQNAGEQPYWAAGYGNRGGNQQYRNPQPAYGQPPGYGYQQAVHSAAPQQTSRRPASPYAPGSRRPQGPNNYQEAQQEASKYERIVQKAERRAGVPVETNLEAQYKTKPEKEKEEERNDLVWCAMCLVVILAVVFIAHSQSVKNKLHAQDKQVEGGQEPAEAAAEPAQAQ